MVKINIEHLDEIDPIQEFENVTLVELIHGMISVSSAGKKLGKLLRINRKRATEKIEQLLGILKERELLLRKEK